MENNEKVVSSRSVDREMVDNKKPLKEVYKMGNWKTFTPEELKEFKCTLLGSSLTILNPESAYKQKFMMAGD